MKAINCLFLSGMLGLAMASCSNDEPAAGGGSGEYTQKFVAVNIVNSEAITRASGENEPGDLDNNYENGLDFENQVNNARCYFFAENGDPFPVTEGGQSWNAFQAQSVGQNPDHQNVAYICKGTVVLSFDKDRDEAAAQLPHSMIVVINLPAGTSFFNANLSRDELKAAIAEYGVAELKTMVTMGRENANFTMSNSVYVDNGEVQCETVLDPDRHIQDSPELAEEKPIDVYVERVAAKLTISGGSNDAKDDLIFPLYRRTSGNDKIPYEIAGHTLRMKVLGYTPAVLTDRSHLVKKVDASWTKESLGFIWNNPTWFRSYWANTAAPEAGYQSPFSFDEIKALGTANPKYCLENVVDNSMPENRTKLVIMGQIVDEKGNGYEIAEWNGTIYTLADLKAHLSNNLSPLQIYTDQDCTETVGASTIGFSQKSAPGEGARYLVNAEFQPVSGNTYYVKSSTGIRTMTDQDVTDINAWLSKSPTMVWKDGYCYYFIDVRHYGATDSVGEFGIVRNHVYKTTIDNVFGLGTPVFNTGEPITPENPDDKFSYVAARINILSWHIVSKNVDLQ